MSYRTIIELTSATTTSSGLTVRAEQDFNHYETGIKVSDEELATIPPRWISGKIRNWSPATGTWTTPSPAQRERRLATA